MTKNPAPTQHKPRGTMVPVILCGGAGSRLWPVSRELHPKPFIRLADGQSLIQKAFLRGTSLPDVSDILIVTNENLLFKMEDEFRELGIDDVSSSFILEPCGRNTAPAIAAAALYVARNFGEDAQLLVLAADHIIQNQSAFADAVSQASQLAAQGKLVTFGITPTSPETGYGYIEVNQNTVVRFVEKPSEANARHYVESGRFLWNSGMFCFTAGVMLAQMREHCPDILETTSHCMGEPHRGTTAEGSLRVELDADLFKTVRNESLDYAVMEKSNAVAVVPCDIGWSDIGSWTALGELSPADSDGNRIQGDVLTHDAQNCTIHSDGRLIGAVGVENLVIIDTPDAVLVADKSRSQDVKHIFAELKQSGHEAHKLHRTVHRPWGTYTVLEEGNGFKIKRIEVKSGASLSLQMHYHRSEHWIVVSGMAQVVNGDREFLVNTNESTYIPAGHKHRLANPGRLPLVIIEVQSGGYLGEDDIKRFDDVYGRQ